MVILAIFILLLAVVIIWQSSTLIKKKGLPEGRLIYSDHSQWKTVTTPLFDRALGLTGKPDYIVKNGRQFIPVEIKSDNGKSSIPDSHIFQLAAYCYLIDNEFHQRPTYGIIHYAPTGLKQENQNPRTYAINYTKSLESTLFSTIEQIRAVDHHQEIPRSHQSPARCKRCGYRSTCDQRL